MRKKISSGTVSPANLAALREAKPWEQGMNPEQLQAIFHDAGPARVIAGPGAGKTRAVVHRIARLVIRDGVPANRILAVTFSKKAATEMEERCKRLGVAQARIGTWHSLCLQILKDDHTEWGSWEIREDASFILKDILGYREMNWKTADFGAVESFVSWCKANLWSPSSPEALECGA